MIRSMTGFGAGRAEQAGEAIAVELRSVNGKFCEVKSRLPRELAAFESELVKLVKARLSRGSVDLTVRRESGPAGRGVVPRVDLQLAAAFAKALREVKGELGLLGDVELKDILQLDGVVKLEEAPADPQAAQAAALQALAGALDALEAMRAREGAALDKDISTRLDAIERAAAQIRALSPGSVEAYRERLAARVQELSRGLTLDPGRLAQEVALFADRVDVAEELTRLASHLAQLRALLGSSEPAGRRFEFLLQETNREVNTIGSKSQAAPIAALIVDMKAELERLREQAANVE